jgi:hypothetical protein
MDRFAWSRGKHCTDSHLLRSKESAILGCASGCQVATSSLKKKAVSNWQLAVSQRIGIGFLVLVSDSTL